MSLSSWAQEEKIYLPKVSNHSPNGTSQEEMNVREKVALLPGEMKAGKPHSTTHLSHQMEPVCPKLPGPVGKVCVCLCVCICLSVPGLDSPGSLGWWGVCVCVCVCVPVSVCVHVHAAWRHAGRRHTGCREGSLSLDCELAAGEPCWGGWG